MLLKNSDFIDKAQTFMINSLSRNEYYEYREYCEAKEDGRLVVLPWRIGDTVYLSNIAFGKKPKKLYIDKMVEPNFRLVDDKQIYVWAFPSQLGKTVFLTREEAEAELKRQEGEE